MGFNISVTCFIYRLPFYLWFHCNFILSDISYFLCSLGIKSSLEDRSVEDMWHMFQVHFYIFLTDNFVVCDMFCSNEQFGDRNRLWKMEELKICNGRIVIVTPSQICFRISLPFTIVCFHSVHHLHLPLSSSFPSSLSYYLPLLFLFISLHRLNFYVSDV